MVAIAKRRRLRFLAIAAALACGCCVIEYGPVFKFDVSTAQLDGMNDVAFRWDLRERDMRVRVDNRTGQLIVIDWPSAKFIDFAGVSHEFAPGSESQMAPGHRVDQVVYPKGFDLYPQFGHKASFAPSRFTPDIALAEGYGKAHVGEEAKIILSVKVSGATRTYVFIVRIDRFTIDRRCIATTS